METCKTCEFWGDGNKYEGIKKPCNNDKISCGCSKDLDSLDAGTDGYDYGIETGPDFGCVHHKCKGVDK